MACRPSATRGVEFLFVAGNPVFPRFAIRLKLAPIRQIPIGAFEMGKTLLLKSFLYAGFSAAIMSIADPAFAADTIQVKFGSYGYAGNRKTVTDDVKKLCDGKPSCTLLVKNETFGGDPSPGDDKGVMIGWSCGATDHKEQFAEGKKASLTCK
jgi:hypothetical protein